MKQLEFPFAKSIQIKKWDGQYSFIHYLADRCFHEAAIRNEEALLECEATMYSFGIS